MSSADDMHWLMAAQDAAGGANCRRRRVGAVVVSVLGRRIGTGANAVPSGVGCMAGGCPRGLLTTDDLPAYADYSSGPGICYAIHAEHAAILSAAVVTSRMDGSTLYCTDRPCADCARLIAVAGIARVVTPEGAEDVQVQAEDHAST